MDEKNYKTMNLYEAAALVATGEKLIGMEVQPSANPRRSQCIFVFEDFDVCSKKALEYTNNELAGLLKDYAEAVKTLKSRVNTV